MADSCKYKRARFPIGEQKAFVSAYISVVRGNAAAARQLGVSKRSITDWKREKYLMPLLKVKVCSRASGIPIPRNIKLEEQFWYVGKGARKGGISTFKKYGSVGGNPAERLRRWRKWWDENGRFRKNPILEPLPFSKPKVSVKLAEFMGIMMGDGGMSKRQVCITLHHIDDLEFSRWVTKLVKELFNVKPSVYHREHNSVNNIVVSRSDLVSYLHELGLPIGNKVKQGFNIPDWIMDDKRYLLACVRGLVDTDGGIYTHNYKVGSKLYSYKKLCFSSSSPALLRTVFEFMKQVGLKPRISQGVDILIENTADVKKYFKVVGSHNPKHLKRYASVL